MHISKVMNYVPSFKKAVCATVIAAQTALSGGCTFAMRSGSGDLFMQMQQQPHIVQNVGYDVMNYCIYCMNGVVHHIHRMTQVHVQRPVLPAPVWVGHPVYMHPGFMPTPMVGPNLIINVR